MESRSLHHRASIRVGAALVAGLGAATALVVTDYSNYSAVGAWIVTGLLYLAWTWLTLGRMDANATRRHALADEGGGPLSKLIVMVGALSSIGGVGLLLYGAQGRGVTEALLGSLTVVVSWFVIPTVYMTHYAEQYYRGSRGIDFNRADYEPRYLDFAYLSFDMAETFQVSDTSIIDPRIRRTVFVQSLLSYFMGTIVLATTINVVVQLASDGG